MGDNKIAKKKVRVGIVGAGYVSAHHLRALKTLSDVEIAALADVNGAKAEVVARQFNVPAAFSSVREMVRHQLDVIHVLTPPESHCPVTIESLEAGCHVLVEKPMAETERDCQRMISAAENAGKILAVNHSARMDPIVLRAARIVASGAIGDVVSADYIRNSDYPPYQGGGLSGPYRKGSYPFQDLGVHGITMLETFLGAAQKAEIGFRSSGFDVNLLFDEWQATLECERGIGRMYLSWNARPIGSELFIRGTRGSLHVDCFLQTCGVVKLLPGPKFASNVLGRMRNAVSDMVNVPANVFRFATGRLQGAPGIHVSIRSFYRSILEGLPIEIPAEEGRRIITLMESACVRADDARQEHRARQLRPLGSASVLVTGAAGFLGRRVVVRLLDQGASVRVLVRRRTQQWADKPNIQVICGDLGDPEVVDRAVEGVQCVIHAGAAMKGSATDFRRGTVVGTQNVIESSLRHGVKRFVYISSLSVLDFAGHDGCAPVTESYTYEPLPEKRGLYTQTKLEAELMVLDAIKQRGLAAVVLRPGQIFGSGSELVTPGGVISLAGHWYVVGSGKLPLSLVYVEDVVDAIILAMRYAGSAHTFNIVDPEPVTQREYLNALERSLTGKIRIKYVPTLPLKTVALGCEVMEKVLRLRLPLSRYRLRSIRPLWPCDVSEAQNDLGWKPTVGSRAALSAMREGVVPSREPRPVDEGTANVERARGIGCPMDAPRASSD
jgi:predicted dehydrogenase/nucleoside-diphosphate-sugar epimerase